AVHGLQAVAHVRQRAVHDGGQRVSQIPLLKRILEVHGRGLGRGEDRLLAHEAWYLLPRGTLRSRTVTGCSYFAHAPVRSVTSARALRRGGPLGPGRLAPRLPRSRLGARAPVRALRGARALRRGGPLLETAWLRHDARVASKR